MPATMMEEQKARLLSSSPFGPDLFDNSLLSEVSSSHKDSVQTQGFVRFLSSQRGGAGKKDSSSSHQPEGAALAGSPLQGHPAQASGATASLFGGSRPYKRGGVWRGSKGKGKGSGRGAAASTSGNQGKGFQK